MPMEQGIHIFTVDVQGLYTHVTVHPDTIRGCCPHLMVLDKTLHPIRGYAKECLRRDHA
jgi:hypothetical protein